MSIDYRDIPADAWAFLDDRVAGKPDECLNKGHVSKGRLMAVDMGLWDGLHTAEHGLTQHGLAAMFWRQEQTGKPAAKPIAASAVEMLVGDEGQAVLKIAQSDKSADDRAIEVCTLDRRFLAWKSPDWGKLLGCSAANIRKGHFWTIWRKNELERD
jgi:hypothetical protein